MGERGKDKEPEITRGEVERAVRRLKNGKAVGEDEIPGQYGNTEQRD